MPLRRDAHGRLMVLGRPTPSDEEPVALLHLRLRQAGFPPAEREYRGLADRRSRFDLAWPKERIAIEHDGGVWIQGRHTRGGGYEADCRKMNAAAASGWVVFRVTPGMIELEWREVVRVLRAAFAMRRRPSDDREFGADN